MVLVSQTEIYSHFIGAKMGLGGDVLSQDAMGIDDDVREDASHTNGVGQTSGNGGNRYF